MNPPRDPPSRFTPSFPFHLSFLFLILFHWPRKGRKKDPDDGRIFFLHFFQIFPRRSCQAVFRLSFMVRSTRILLSPPLLS